MEKVVGVIIGGVLSYGVNNYWRFKPQYTVEDVTKDMVYIRQNWNIDDSGDPQFSPTKVKMNKIISIHREETKRPPRISQHPDRDDAGQSTQL